MVAYSQAKLAGAAQHALAAGGLLPGGAIAGLVGEDGRANVGVGRVRVVAKRLDLGVNHRNFIRHFARQALVIQSLHGLSVRPT